ncbi:MAG: hypothetical protein ACTHOK_10275 [Nocardioidaceae bacterium]
MENTRTMEQIAGLAVTLVLFLGLVTAWFTLDRRLRRASRRTTPWADHSRLVGYASMAAPVPELEIVRLGRVLAAEVESYLAAQVS